MTNVWVTATHGYSSPGRINAYGCENFAREPIGHDVLRAPVISGEWVQGADPRYEVAGIQCAWHLQALCHQHHSSITARTTNRRRT